MDLWPWAVFSDFHKLFGISIQSRSSHNWVSSSSGGVCGVSPGQLSQQFLFECFAGRRRMMFVILSSGDTGTKSEEIASANLLLLIKILSKAAGWSFEAGTANSACRKRSMAPRHSRAQRSTSTSLKLILIILSVIVVRPVSGSYSGMITSWRDCNEVEMGGRP